MASMIFVRDKGRVMSAFMASMTQVGTFSQHLSYASKVLGACTFDA
jgi:hypothetical protein